MALQDLVEALNARLRGLAWNQPSVRPVILLRGLQKIVIERLPQIDGVMQFQDFELDLNQQAKADGLFQILKHALDAVKIKYEKEYEEGLLPRLTIDLKANALEDNDELISKLNAIFDEASDTPKNRLASFHPEVNANLPLISNEAWQAAKKYFEENPNKNKYSRKLNGLFRSFYRINDSVYATVGKIGEGKVYKDSWERKPNRRIVRVLSLVDETNKYFALKIERIALNTHRLGIIHLMRKLGFLFGVFQRSQGYGSFPKVYSLHPYLPQESLIDFLISKRKAITNIQVLKIVLGCAEAIHALHKRGIAHGDVKPDNFQIETKDNTIHITLLDLEFAVKIPKDKLYVRKKANEGTEEYLPPEMLRHRECHFAGDIFGLGRLLEITLDDSLCEKKWPEWNTLCTQMLRAAPGERPSCEQVITSLIQIAKNKQCLYEEEELSLTQNLSVPLRSFNKNTLLQFQDYVRKNENIESESIGTVESAPNRLTFPSARSYL